MAKSYQGLIYSLNVSDGGVPKWPIESATINALGITEDHQSDHGAHGGPIRALCLYSVEVLQALAEEGHDVYPGATGENITLEGIDWDIVRPGARLRLGEQVLIEITSFTEPCWKNACWFTDGDYSRMDDAVFPGWARVYAKVIEGGEVQRGQRAEVIPETAMDRIARLSIRTINYTPN